MALALALGAPAASQSEPGTERLPEEIAEQRRQMARQAVVLSAPPLALATDAELVNALDLDGGSVTGVTVAGDPSAIAVVPGLGVIQPRQGADFVVLSSGQASVPIPPEPGTDFSPQGTAGDRAVLTVTFEPPPGTSRLSFDYNFLSSEFPDFVGTAFNDTFEARLTDSAGTRLVAFASVNTSRFFPASSETAGGSGFDLFAEDPSAVDTVFGTGLPDAGLTDFTFVDVAYEPGSTLTLELSIEDRGDGILDSSVIVDNLVVSGLEALDANDTLFLVGGAVPNDPQRLSAGGRRVVAAAADGVSRVLLRASTPGPGSVTFSILGSGSEGALFTLGGGGGGTSITVPAVGTPSGRKAFAVYLPPDDFNQGGHEADTERGFQLQAEFDPVSGPPSVTTIPFTLVRPPLLLLHGLWSAADTWNLPLLSDPRLRVLAADYSQTHAASVETNREVAFEWIRAALGSLRVRGIAVTQVDLAAHSMGGLLARKWAASSRYQRDSNFHAGDIHKLITLDTPHTGSPLADLLVLLRDGFLGGAVVAGFDHLAKPIDQGAIDDLTVCSSAQLLLGTTPIPSHALVGIGGSDALALTPGWLGNFYTLVNFFASTTGLFESLQHDAVVGRSSQEGGLASSATTTIGGLAGLHFFNTVSGQYSDRIVELLNTASSGASFATLPAPAVLCSGSRPSPAILSVPVSGTTPVPGLEITSPAPETDVAPGEAVAVVVTPDAGVSVDEVLLTGPEVALLDATPPFELALTVPQEAAGTFELSALGKNAGGEFFTGPPLTLRVVNLPPLDGLRMVPRDARVVGQGNGLQLTVLGTFDDGVTREITESITGTVFQSSNPEIAEVSAEGLVTVTGSGRATLVARNSGLQDSVTLSFVFSPDDLVLADQIVSTTEQFEACNSITLGDRFEVAQPGDVALVAGREVAFENGSSLGAGSLVTVILDPEVFCD